MYVPYVDPSATWSDYTDFDPYAYLRDKYKVDVATFLKASVADCKSPEDCDKLYNELKELFRN